MKTVNITNFYFKGHQNIVLAVKKILNANNYYLFKIKNIAAFF